MESAERDEEVEGGEGELGAAEGGIVKDGFVEKHDCDCCGDVDCDPEDEFP